MKSQTTIRMDAWTWDALLAWVYQNGLSVDLRRRVVELMLLHPTAPRGTSGTREMLRLEDADRYERQALLLRYANGELVIEETGKVTVLPEGSAKPRLTYEPTESLPKGLGGFFA